LVIVLYDAFGLKNWHAEMYKTRMATAGNYFVPRAIFKFARTSGSEV